MRTRLRRLFHFPSLTNYYFHFLSLSLSLSRQQMKRSRKPYHPLHFHRQVLPVTRIRPIHRVLVSMPSSLVLHHPPFPTSPMISRFLLLRFLLPLPHLLLLLPPSPTLLLLLPLLLLHHQFILCLILITCRLPIHIPRLCIHCTIHHINILQPTSCMLRLLLSQLLPPHQLWYLCTAHCLLW